MNAPKPTPAQALRLMRDLFERLSGDHFQLRGLGQVRERGIKAALDAADKALDAPECNCGVEEYQHALGCPANPDEAPKTPGVFGLGTCHAHSPLHTIDACVAAFARDPRGAARARVRVHLLPWRARGEAVKPMEALRQIARTRYGLTGHESDEELVMYWFGVALEYQAIARAALYESLAGPGLCAACSAEKTVKP